VTDQQAFRIKVFEQQCCRRRRRLRRDRLDAIDGEDDDQLQQFLAVARRAIRSLGIRLAPPVDGAAVSQLVAAGLPANATVSTTVDGAAVSQVTAVGLSANATVSTTVDGAPAPASALLSVPATGAQPVGTARGASATLYQAAGSTIGGPAVTLGPSANALPSITAGGLLAATSPAGNPPQGIVAGPNAVRSAQNSARGGDLGGSFVGLGLSLGWSSAAATAPVAAPPEPPAGAPAAGSHSSSVNAAGTQNAGKAAVIAWNSDNISALAGSLDTGGSGASQDWLGDFINHLGQNEAVWNPNAGIRVRPTIATAGS
jgi:hypothetical protein